MRLALLTLAAPIALLAPAAAAEPVCAAPDVAVQVVEGGILEAKTTRMGTNLQLGVSGVPCDQALDAFRAVYAEFDRVEQLVRDDGDGTLARLNSAAGGAAVAVDPELLGLVATAVDFAKKTGGAFDPTFAAMKDLWRFDGSDVVPTGDAISAARAHVDYKKLHLDHGAKTLRLDEAGMRIELGGIAKGYAVDRAVALLRARGIEDFVIRSGGELFVSGDPGGGHRRVGVPDPRGDGPFALIDVQDRAVNISTDGQRFFVKDGARYHDKIDPKTGRPATRSRAVAVVSTDATTADALSTALFILGPAGMELIEALPGTDAILVDEDNVVHLSSNIGRGRFELRAPTK
jgi:thiamine biosynthesis lipoprotein